MTRVVPKAPPWFRVRHYLHFDNPLGARSAQRIAGDAACVEHHAFYPLIHTVVTTIKVEKNKQTGKIEQKQKNRDIAYAAHADSHIYAYYAHLLNQRYEELLTERGLTGCVLAFRPLGKSNVTFAQEAFDEILKRQHCDVVAFDIKGFFDHLDHKILKDAWQRVLDTKRLPADHYNVYKSVTRWARVDKHGLYKQLGISRHNPKKGRRRLCTPDIFRQKVRPHIERNQFQKGIPQGTPISATLSNIYLLWFDEQLHALAQQLDARYLRYCDDIIVIGPPASAQTIKNYVTERVADVKLELQHDKTDERTFTPNNGRLHTSGPLQYLGFLFDGKHIRIRPSSIARYCDRMRRGIATAKNTSAKYNYARAKRHHQNKPLYRKKIYRRYAYLGRRNFISYAYNAANRMSAKAIKRQLKPLLRKLTTALKK